MLNLILVSYSSLLACGRSKPPSADDGVHGDDHVPLHVDQQHSRSRHDGAYRPGNPGGALQGTHVTNTKMFASFLF